LHRMKSGLRWARLGRVTWVDEAGYVVNFVGQVAVGVARRLRRMLEGHLLCKVRRRCTVTDRSRVSRMGSDVALPGCRRVVLDSSMMRRRAGTMYCASDWRIRAIRLTVFLLLQMLLLLLLHLLLLVVTVQWVMDVVWVGVRLTGLMRLRGRA
jgi:hypothetical protein